MSNTVLHNSIYTGANGKKSLFDLEIPANHSNRLLVFIHGYMGFKDWGCWGLMQQYFVERNFGFCKYNASHNGVSIENSMEFVDLSSFSINSYQKELDDLNALLDEILTLWTTLPEIYLIGHSRGGGIALLAAKDPHIKGVVTMASICSIEERFPTGEALDNWRKEGVRYVTNGRTKQEMPHDIIQYLDYLQNKENLNIEQACLQLNKPACIIHGTDDTSVTIEEGKRISHWLKQNLRAVEGANHTFGSSHPWLENNMPEHLRQVCEQIDSFLTFV